MQPEFAQLSANGSLCPLPSEGNLQRAKFMFLTKQLSLEYSLKESLQMISGTFWVLPIHRLGLRPPDKALIVSSSETISAK
jgi:hypothetical protein